jgi:hypothetical protein
MAGSIAAAFADVAGPELDALIGLAPPPHPAAPTPEGIQRAFERFDYRQVREIVRRLVSRYRCSDSDAEDATHDAIEYMLSERPDVFSAGRERWLRYLRALSRFRLLQIRAAPKAVSLEALRAAAGDAALADARPIESVYPEAIEDARAAPLPGTGEEWSQKQSIGALQRFGDHHERPPTARECRRIHGLPSHSTLRKLFGGLPEALRAAGMLPRTRARRRRRWTAVEAARACYSFRLRHGHWPEWIDLQMNPGSLPGRSTMIKFFGNTRSGQVQEQAEAILGLSR